MNTENLVLFYLKIFVFRGINIWRHFKMFKREGVFAETKEEICRNKDKKASFKNQEEREIRCRTASGTSGRMELRAPGIETTTRQGWSSMRRQRGAPPCAARSWGRDGARVLRSVITSWIDHIY